MSIQSLTAPSRSPLLSEGLYLTCRISPCKNVHAASEPAGHSCSVPRPYGSSAWDNEKGPGGSRICNRSWLLSIPGCYLDQTHNQSSNPYTDTQCEASPAFPSGIVRIEAFCLRCSLWRLRVVSKPEPSHSSPLPRKADGAWRVEMRQQGLVLPENMVSDDQTPFWSQSGNRYWRLHPKGNVKISWVNLCL